MLTEPAQRVLEIIRDRGPSLYSTIAVQLDDEGIDVEDDDDLIFELTESREVLWLPAEDDDEWLLTLEHAVEGAIVTHRVTPDERAHGFLRVDPDLSLLGSDERFDRLEEDDAGVVMPADRPDLGLPDHAWAFLAPGWLDDVADGELIGIRWSQGSAEILRGIAAMPAGDAPKTIRQAYERLAEGDGACELDQVTVMATVLDPALFRQPLPPVSELLTEAGLSAHGEWVGPAGTDWDDLFRRRHAAYLRRDYELDEDGALGLAQLVEAINRGLPAPPPDEVARLLADERVTEAFEVVLLQEAEQYVAVGDLLQSVLGAGVESAGVHWIVAVLAETGGDTEVGRLALDAALDTDPSFGPALRDAAWYAIDAGDVGKATALVQRAESTLQDAALGWAEAYTGQGPSSAGRNEPCPCGSGRKHKACCGPRRGWSLFDRMPLLADKARYFVHRIPQHDVFRPALRAHAGDDEDEIRATVLAFADPALADLVLFEGALLERFLAVRGPLLPADEQELAHGWVGARHRVWDVVAVEPQDDGAHLRDVISGEEVAVRVAPGLGRQLQSDRVFAVVGPGPGGDLAVISEVVAVTDEEATALRPLLEADAPLDDIAAWLGDVRRAAGGLGGADEAERREWLFPPGTEALDHLDPGDETDMGVLVQFEHPEVEEALEADEDEMVMGGEVVNPRLHLAMHQIVATQIWNGDPPGTWHTASRLSDLGYDRHEVLHMLGSAVSHQIWHMLAEKEPFNLAEFLDDLEDLPESWEEERHRRRQSDTRHHRPQHRRRPHRR